MNLPRTMPVFDTHKAVKALCHAGFDDAQAEAVVEQINDAVNENVATKSDLERVATKDDLARFATKDDLERFATKEDLERFATKKELERFATKEELAAAVAPLATKEELAAAVAPLATKEELRIFKEEMRQALSEVPTKAEMHEAIDRCATKEELAQLELRISAKFEKQTGMLLRYAIGIVALVVALNKALDFVVG